MDDLLVVVLEAHHSERNHHRRYELAVGRDLFGAWTVTIRYGRSGRGGQQRRYAHGTADGVRAVLRAALLRRLSAPRRIGCHYRLVTTSSGGGVDPGDWLPAAVLARFGGSDTVRVPIPQ